MRILMTGGGTAGHINPAIAIANTFKQKDDSSEILFVGTENGLEKNLVPRAGYDIKFIHAKGFRRKLSLENIAVLLRFIQGYLEASRIIKEFKPDVAIGTGGYVTGAVLYSAHRHGVPVVIHESNAFAGVTNRFVSGFTKLAFVNFENTVSAFRKAEKTIVSGNPLKKAASFTLSSFPWIEIDLVNTSLLLDSACTADPLYSYTIIFAHRFLLLPS
jgi:UDP-N-acetylglucosamine--N-acetylmuramyl-(pentapeptide) pyrophosphoryl-undecaprenol N-acetylglucosamine transferase